MSDRIYLSCWVRGFTEHNMLSTFQKVLTRFPFSRLRPQATLRVYAIEFTEPPQMEHRFEDDLNAADIVRLAREFENPDCAYQVDAFWDLLTHDADWQLAPVPVSIVCHGPLFESDLGEQFLLELGMDDQFLPRPGLEGGLIAVRSNIRSLLHMVEDMGRTVSLEKKLLWSESGSNFAEEVEAAMR